SYFPSGPQKVLAGFGQTFRGDLSGVTPLRVLLYFELVTHRLHAAHCLRDLPGLSLRIVRVDEAGEEHLAVARVDVDLVSLGQRVLDQGSLDLGSHHTVIDDGTRG